jgi:hypothetical protein
MVRETRRLVATGPVTCRVPAGIDPSNTVDEPLAA